jgi:hypothetical protein
MDGLDNEVVDNQLYVLEYSKSQNCFHIDPIERVVINNYNAICGVNRPPYFPDYIPIAYGTTEHIQMIKRIFCAVNKIQEVKI